MKEEVHAVIQMKRKMKYATGDLMNIATPEKVEEFSCIL
jgi:hypothetical protein